MLQIASGILRGIPLRSPKGEQTRPTTERLRQTIFNMLRNQTPSVLEEAVVVDLFAGTGALGLEAISNGAKEVWFIESDRGALSVLSANVKEIQGHLVKQGFDLPKIHILSGEVGKLYAKLPQLTLAFADPPYGKQFFEEVVALEQKHAKIASGSFLVFEERQTVSLLPDSSVFVLQTEKKYGDSAIHFFVKQ